MARFKVSLSQGAFTWESQAEQYPERGNPGIGYYAGDVSASHPGKPPIHCLLYREEGGNLVGILNYYEADYPPWETAGNVNMWVKPEYQRKGIGTALLDEAMGRWPISLDQQRYTEQGAVFAEAFLAHHDEQGTVPGRKVCGVCGRVLDYLEGHGYMHSVTTTDPEEIDHPAVPVADHEVHVRERCDFCYGEDVVWVVPARDFVYGPSQSVGDWAACAPCGALIQRNEWTRLLRRVTASWVERHGDLDPTVETQFRSLYRALRKNLNGALRPTKKGDGGDSDNAHS